MTGLPAMTPGEIAGTVVLPGGVGGGGDIYQAGSAALLLENHGKQVPAVFSVRRGEFAEYLANLDIIEVIDAENHLIRIFPETVVVGKIGSSNRLPELGVARANPDLPVYLVIDNDKGETLDQKIKALAQYVGEQYGSQVDTVVGVDTGGDALESAITAGEDGSKSTPDQDHTSAAAIGRLSDYSTYTFVVAPGIDTPDNFAEVLAEAESAVYMPDRSELDAISEYLERSGLGSDPGVFSRTSLVYKALASEASEAVGHTYIDGIPLDKRLSRGNPWMSWVPLHESMRAVCFMETSKHLAAIGLVD